MTVETAAPVSLPKLLVQVTSADGSTRIVEFDDPRAEWVALYNDHQLNRAAGRTAEPVTNGKLPVEIQGNDGYRRQIELDDPRSRFCETFNAEPLNQFDGLQAVAPCRVVDHEAASSPTGEGSEV